MGIAAAMYVSNLQAVVAQAVCGRLGRHVRAAGPSTKDALNPPRASARRSCRAASSEPYSASRTAVVLPTASSAYPARHQAAGAAEAALSSVACGCVIACSVVQAQGQDALRACKRRSVPGLLSFVVFTHVCSWCVWWSWYVWMPCWGGVRSDVALALCCHGVCSPAVAHCQHGASCCSRGRAHTCCEALSYAPSAASTAGAYVAGSPPAASTRRSAPSAWRFSPWSSCDGGAIPCRWAVWTATRQPPPVLGLLAAARLLTEPSGPEAYAWAPPAITKPVLLSGASSAH